MLLLNHRARLAAPGERLDARRRSGPVRGKRADRRDGGVAHGGRLLALTDAVMGADDDVLASERRALRGLLSNDAFVDTCAVIGAFNVVDRIADATGIPLDAGWPR